MATDKLDAEKWAKKLKDGVNQIIVKDKNLGRVFPMQGLESLNESLMKFARHFLSELPQLTAGTRETVSEEEADELNEMIAGWSKDFDGSLDDLDEIHRAMRNAYQLGRNHVSLPPSTVTDEELASEYGKIQQCVWEEMLNESEKWSNPTPEKMHQLSVEAMHRFHSHLSGVACKNK